MEEYSRIINLRKRLGIAVAISLPILILITYRLSGANDIVLFPIISILLPLCICGIIIVIINIYFKIYEFRVLGVNRNPLLFDIKNTLFTFFIMLFVLLSLIILPDTFLIKSALAMEERYEADPYGDVSYEFESRDPVGISRVRYVGVESDTDVNIYLKRDNITIHQSNGIVKKEKFNTMELIPEKYSVTVVNPSFNEAKGKFKIQRIIEPGIYGILIAFSLFIVIVKSLWLVYLSHLRKRDMGVYA